MNSHNNDIDPWSPEYLQSSLLKGNISLEIKDQYERLGKYKSLSPVGKSLLQLIYPNLKEYLINYENPLEPYIFAFDESLDDEGTVRALGSRLGIYIPIDNNYLAYEIFIDKIVEVILTYGKLNPQKVEKQYQKSQQFPEISEIIDMDFDTFKKIANITDIIRPVENEDTDIEEINISDDIRYQDRMMYFADLYKNQL
jgi:hypothetical protein